MYPLENEMSHRPSPFASLPTSTYAPNGVALVFRTVGVAFPSTLNTMYGQFVYESPT
jgi:hypothetical protein